MELSNKNMSKQIISTIESRDEFLKILKMNPGLFIIKFGASWCGPCKKIKNVVDGFFVSSPSNVLCADIDVDESIDLYSYLKSKRMINGIPAIFCYKRGNIGFAPDDSVTGAEPGSLHAFFTRCSLYLKNNTVLH